jgi:hypothetical protein
MKPQLAAGLMIFVTLLSFGCQQQKSADGEDPNRTLKVVMNDEAQTNSDLIGLWQVNENANNENVSYSTEAVKDLAFQVDGGANLFVHQYSFKTNQTERIGLGHLKYVAGRGGDLIPDVEGFIRWKRPVYTVLCKQGGRYNDVEALLSQVRANISKGYGFLKWNVQTGVFSFPDPLSLRQTLSMVKFSSESFEAMKEGNADMHDRLVSQKAQKVQAMISHTYRLARIGVQAPQLAYTEFPATEPHSFSCPTSNSQSIAVDVAVPANVREISTSGSDNIMVLNSNMDHPVSVPLEYIRTSNYLDRTLISDNLYFYDPEKCANGKCSPHLMNLDGLGVLKVNAVYECLTLTYIFETINQ